MARLLLFIRLTGRASRKMAALLGASLAIVVGLGVGQAYGYFTGGSGSASGAAPVGNVSISLTLTAGSGLFPGGSVNVTVKVNNTSVSHSLTLASLTGGTTTISPAGAGPCDPSAVSFVAGAMPAPIAAGSSADVSGTVSMSTGAQNGCQGTTFSIPLTATGRTS